MFFFSLFYRSMSGQCILVTGGAGFVGSHSVIELISAGYSVVVVDNFVNASHGKFFLDIYKFDILKDYV